jgi:RHS repeat-associated protein
MDVAEKDMITPTITEQSFYRELGKKQYELSNHLGNVLTVITDKKIPIDDNTDQTVDYFVVEILTASDYSPFGAIMPGRNYNAGDYRFGYQKQEMDNEVAGVGNSIQFKYRIYDPRTGRFWSVDPLTSKYPHNSPYAFSENSVIAFIELEGLEKVTFQTYSFAPFASFGAGYSGNGDNRKFGDPIVSTYGKENYKIGAQVKLDLATDKVLMKQALGSLSKHNPTGVTAFSEAEFEDFSYSNGTLSMSLAGNNDAFLWGASADIDVHAGVGFVLNSNKTELFVTGWTMGDRFPANESFLTDEAGARVFLGVTGADGGPYTSLPGYGDRDMSKFSFSIMLNDKGNFTGVKTMDGTTYGLDAWNKMFQNLNPQDGNTGTNVQQDGTIQTDYK